MNTTTKIFEETYPELAKEFKKIQQAKLFHKFSLCYSSSYCFGDMVYST